jgi:hypothetical protein
MNIHSVHTVVIPYSFHHHNYQQLKITLLVCSDPKGASSTCRTPCNAMTNGLVSLHLQIL